MRHPKVFLSWLPLALAMAVPATAAAQQQMVAFDVVYTNQMYDGTVKNETFHHLVLPRADQPADWTSPIDYSKGTAYIYLDVMTKPSARNTIMTICFDGDLEGYGCLDTNTYTTTGVHESKFAMTSTWQYGKIAWKKKRTQFHLVIKDPALGGTQGGKPAGDYVPSMMRVVLTIVPPGGTYVAPGPYMGAPPDGGATAEDAGSASPGDAAAPATEADATAATPDAAATPDPVTKPDAAAPPARKLDAAPKGGDEPGTGGSGGSDPGGEDTDPPAAKAKSGCSFAGGTASSAAPLLLLALALASRRRRRR
jgi:MYXO-CTERM domain-containing protein